MWYVVDGGRQAYRSRREERQGQQAAAASPSAFSSRSQGREDPAFAPPFVSSASFVPYTPPPTSQALISSSPTRRKAPGSGILVSLLQPYARHPGQAAAGRATRGLALFFASLPSLRLSRRTGVAGEVGDLAAAARCE